MSVIIKIKGESLATEFSDGERVFEDNEFISIKDNAMNRTYHYNKSEVQYYRVENK